MPDDAAFIDLGPPNSPPAMDRRISRIVMAIQANVTNRATEKPKLWSEIMCCGNIEHKRIAHFVRNLKLILISDFCRKWDGTGVVQGKNTLC